MSDNIFKFFVQSARTIHIFGVLSAVAIFNLFENVGKGLSYTEEDISKGE